MCRYFVNGECWRQDKCKFLHDGAKKIEKESIPLCKNGVNCSFLARGICNFSHRKVGVQNKRIFINLNKPSPPPARNFPQNNNHDSRPWCKFLEDCIRAPHCNFKYYDEVFPKLPKTNNPPWYKKPINVGRILNTRKTKKIKRGGKKYKNQSLVLLSANAEGLKLKVESLKN